MWGRFGEFKAEFLQDFGVSISINIELAHYVSVDALVDRIAKLIS